MSTTLENQLETAYSKLALACEPTLAEVPFRLNTLLLAQPVPVDAQGDDPDAAESNEQVPVPYVLLTAKKGQNNPPGSRIFEGELTIEVGDNAQPASADGGRLDALFAAATAPLLIKRITDDTTGIVKTPFQALTDAVENLRVFGMPDRGEASDLTYEGSIIKRAQTAKFLCGCPTP